MVQQQLPGHEGNVIGAGQMLCCGGLVVQAGAVDKVGVLHAQLLGAGIHFLHKSSLAACKELRHGAGAVVGRGHGNGFHHLLHRHGLPHLQIDLTATLGRRRLRGSYGILPGDFPGIHRLHNEKQSHHLGDAGWRQPFMRIGLVQHRPCSQIHKHRRRRSQLQVYRTSRKRQHSTQYACQKQHNDDSFTHIHPSRFCYSLCSRGQEYDGQSRLTGGYQKAAGRAHRPLPQLVEFYPF